jgi:SPP1 gp7 family putative phage head morphogenesis protein
MSMRKEFLRLFLRLQEQIDKVVANKEKGIIADYKAALDELRNLMAVTYAKYETAGVLLFSEMAKYSRSAKLDKEIQGILTELGKKNAKSTRDVMKLVYTESFDRTKNLVEIATDRKIPGIIKDGVLEQALENPVKGLKLSRTLEKNRVNIIYTIQQTVEQGLKNGETYGQMAGRLKESLENDVPKALRVVRTETHRVMEQGKHDSLGNAQAAGIELVKIWVSSRDERVRASHASMDGVTVDYDEDFVNPFTGGKGPGPGMMGVAADDINCRCIFTIDIK